MFDVEPFRQSCVDCHCDHSNTCDGADRTRRAAADLQREADEAEPPAADQLVEVGEAFHVRDAAFRARHVRKVVRFAFRRRTDRLDAEHQDAAVGQPVHQFQREAGEVVQIARLAEQPIVGRHVEQHGVARADLLAGLVERRLHLRHRDRVLQRHVRQVETDRRRVEILQRHFVDRQRAGSRIEMHRRIDMRAGVIRQRDRQRLRGEHRVAGDLLLRVIAPHRDDHRRMRRMGLRAVEQLAAEVDEFHGRGLRGGCCRDATLSHRTGGSNHGRIVRRPGDDAAREGGGRVRVHRGTAVASGRVLVLRRYPPEPAVPHGARAEAGGGAQDDRRQRHDVRSTGTAGPVRGRWPHGDAAGGRWHGDDAGGSLRGQEAEPAERRDLPFQRLAVFHRSGLSRADGGARAGCRGVSHRAGWHGEPGGAGGVSERTGAVAG